MNRYFSSLFFILLACIALPLQAQKEIPELWGQHVHDEAKALSQQTVDNLERQLKIFEDSTTNQIAILIVPSLDGEIIEQYGLRVAEKWKLGQKDKDNGVLLLLAINDRKMRIEVGQGLEGPLPDAICNRIIRNEMAPNFRRGDYDAGVNAAVNAIMLSIKGEYKADDAPIGQRNRGPKLPLVLIILVIIILGRILNRNRGGGSGWSSGGGFFIGGGGGGSWGGGGGGFSGGGGSFGGGGSSGSS
jgi:uncharacterized protein